MPGGPVESGCGGCSAWGGAGARTGRRFRRSRWRGSATGVRLFGREAGPDGGRSSRTGRAMSGGRVCGLRATRGRWAVLVLDGGEGVVAGGAAPGDGVPSSPWPIGGPPHPADSACSPPSATLLRTQHRPPQGRPQPLPHDSPRHRPVPGPGPGTSSRPPATVPGAPAPRRTTARPHHHQTCRTTTGTKAHPPFSSPSPSPRLRPTPPPPAGTRRTPCAVRGPARSRGGGPAGGRGRRGGGGRSRRRR